MKLQKVSEISLAPTCMYKRNVVWSAKRCCIVICQLQSLSRVKCAKLPFTTLSELNVWLSTKWAEQRLFDDSNYFETPTYCREQVFQLQTKLHFAIFCIIFIFVAIQIRHGWDEIINKEIFQSMRAIKKILSICCHACVIK